MKAFLILILSLSFTLTAIGQDYPDSGFTNKAEAKNLTVNGLKEGKWVEYYENGKIETESSYKNGLRNGVRKFYNESGILLHETPFLDDTINGIEKEYYDSGKIKNEIQYTNGLKVSTKYYNENGNSIVTSYNDSPLDNPKNINYKELYGKWKVTNYRNIGIRGLSQNDMDTEIAVTNRCFKEGLIIIDSNGFREIGDFCEVVKCDRYNFEKECIYHVRTILADKEGLDYLSDEEFDWENEGATVVSKKFIDIIDENYTKDKITVINTKCDCEWGSFTYNIYIINQNKFALYSSADIEILERIK
jgi:hypothetical protein